MGKAEQEAAMIETRLSRAEERISIDFLCWLSDQVTGLLIAFGEAHVEGRTEAYVEALKDIPRDRLQIAFHKALMELEWFPKIAKLRALSGFAPSESDCKDLEGHAAWELALRHLRKWGANGMPLWSGGKEIKPPALPSRIAYAARQVGGLARIAQATSETTFDDYGRGIPASLPFIKKDFLEAYRQSAVAEQLHLGDPDECLKRLGEVIEGFSLGDHRMSAPKGVR